MRSMYEDPEIPSQGLHEALQRLDITNLPDMREGDSLQKVKDFASTFKLDRLPEIQHPTA